MKQVVLTGLVIAGCGNVSNKGIDAAVHDSRAVDGSVDASPPRCSKTGAFGAPMPLDTVNSTSFNDEGAFLSPDELTLYFSSTRTPSLGGWDIWYATRATRTDPFGDVMSVNGVNDTSLQRFPMVTSDGLKMYVLFGANPNYDIGVASRNNTMQPFSLAASVTELNVSNANDEGYSILPNGNALFFDSNRDGQYKLYRAARQASGTFDTPILLQGTDINKTDNDSSPIMSSDELTLFFASNRTAGGQGSYDVWMATRATTADGFGAAVNLTVVNTGGIDEPSWISADGCFLYGFGGSPYKMWVSQRAM